jgi:hypothetical protein
MVLLKQSGASPGGATVVYPNAVGPYCTVAPASLTWNFNKTPYGDVADFGVNAPWSPGDVILLNLTLIAAMRTPSGVGSATIAVTSDQTLSGQQIGNTAFIDALQFYWGCVAARTRVRMADGTTRAIRDVRDGDRVAGEDNTTWVVSGVTTGEERKPMVRVTTADGASVLVTDGHPVMTPAGPLVARALAVGDSVITDAGRSTIVAIEEEMCDEGVFNLLLDAADGSTPPLASFYADGILVGDDRMQAMVERATNDAMAQAALDELLESAYVAPAF